MKKIVLLLLFCAVNSFIYAQFNIDSITGNIGIGSIPYDDTRIILRSDWRDSSYVGHYVYGIDQKMNIGRGDWAIGVSGQTSGRYGIPERCTATGVAGMAGNGCNGYNIGVSGSIFNLNGAGVFGSSNGHPYRNIDKKYAGYFWGKVCVTDSLLLGGPTRVSGNILATDFVTLSDINLKENVKKLVDEKGSSTLNKLLDLNVITYNYKKQLFKKGGDVIQKMDERGNLVQTVSEDIFTGIDPDQRHYGLSAQELQNIYPDLVRKDADGTLGVNYVELVPILIRSIQELKEELDDVRSGSEYKTRSVGDKTADYNANTGNVLYQNTPNPFKEQTTIRFRLADDATNAAICIFDMSGKILKKLPVSSGMTSITINGYELGEGLYLYSLMVNGREIDTKRMFLSK